MSESIVAAICWTIVAVTAMVTAMVCATVAWKDGNIEIQFRDKSDDEDKEDSK